MHENTPIFHSLRLGELVLSVRLGCTEAERVKTQEVRISIELRFSQAPRGTRTDALDDTICYAKIANSIRALCQSREYHLIEKMAYDAYEVTREVAGSGVAIGVSVHKVRPPVENLIGGTVFRCGDFAI